MKNIIIFSFFIPLFLNAQEDYLIRWDNTYQDTSIVQDYYFAWKIKNIENILIVAEGYSDGIDYSFYNVIDIDSIALIFRFNPVIIDTSNKSQDYYWGYPWDINDIKIKYNDGNFVVLSSTQHSIERDGEINIPKFQKILPAIFFTGKSTQPTIKVGKINNIDYRSVSEIKMLIE